MKIMVESASLQDIEELWRIERECFTREAFSREQILSLLKNPDAVGLLAQVNGEVAGFIIGLVEKHGAIKAGHVLTIDVAVKYRRRGVGIKLLEEMEKTFLKRGAETSYLEVRADNQTARRLYQRQGYQEIQPLYDYYSNGIHGLRLKKQLKPRRTLSFQP